MMVNRFINSLCYFRLCLHAPDSDNCRTSSHRRFDFRILVLIEHLQLEPLHVVKSPLASSLREQPIARSPLANVLEFASEEQICNQEAE